LRLAAVEFAYYDGHDNIKGVEAADDVDYTSSLCSRIEVRSSSFSRMLSFCSLIPGKESEKPSR
jgi:hypothetical protein